jgi:hypothetical protein
MRKPLAIAALLLVAVPPLWTAVSACGDKFLLIGRGGRFTQVYAAIYPATILLYAPAGRAASAAILDPKFQLSLTRAGHRVEVVKDEAQVGALLQAGRFDLVLSDVADVEALKAKAALSVSQPTVMPVMFNLGKVEAEAIKARYQCDLRPSDRPARYLSTIDDEMQRRVKARAARKTS